MSSSSPEILNFGRNLRRLRELHGLTVEELAKELRLSPRTVQNLEKGILHPHLSARVLYRIFYLYGVMPSALFSPPPEE